MAWGACAPGGLVELTQALAPGAPVAQLPVAEMAMGQNPNRTSQSPLK